MKHDILVLIFWAQQWSSQKKFRSGILAMWGNFGGFLQTNEENF